MMAGGQTVTKMPTDAFIFLIMLCLLSAPLMNVFKGFVPWAKKQTSGIIKLLSKI